MSSRMSTPDFVFPNTVFCWRDRHLARIPHRVLFWAEDVLRGPLFGQEGDVLWFSSGVDVGLPIFM